MSRPPLPRQSSAKNLLKRGVAFHPSGENIQGAGIHDIDDLKNAIAGLRHITQEDKKPKSPHEIISGILSGRGSSGSIHAASKGSPGSIHAASRGSPGSLSSRGPSGSLSSRSSSGSLSSRKVFGDLGDIRKYELAISNCTDNPVFINVSLPELRDAVEKQTLHKNLGMSIRQAFCYGKGHENCKITWLNIYENLNNEKTKKPRDRNKIRFLSNWLKLLELIIKGDGTNETNINIGKLFLFLLESCEDFKKSFKYTPLSVLNSLSAARILYLSDFYKKYRQELEREIKDIEASRAYKIESKREAELEEQRKRKSLIRGYLAAGEEARLKAQQEMEDEDLLFGRRKRKIRRPKTIKYMGRKYKVRKIIKNKKTKLFIIRKGKKVYLKNLKKSRFGYVRRR